jgi:DNA invertase Pin-like site-specific DNA recombinase
MQYQLKKRAEELGWADDRVLVIDDDLGKSATTMEGRVGFQRLIAEVALDHVGIIFGIEMSRLARSCKDWYHLLEVCSVYGALIADLDGVYNPAHYNDRLLLGLKGTMSEAELHILKQRMNQGRLNKARRGELVISVPAGYVRRPSGDVTLDPDDQVQQIVRLIFQKFEELGTVGAVLKFFVYHEILLPVRTRIRERKGELEWHRPSRVALQNILKHPIYAGAYTFGRRAVDPRRKVPGRPGTGHRVVPPEQWKVFLKDRFPAYISWEQYESNLSRLRANLSSAKSAGAPKRGPSLLCGLLVCSKCGCRMVVRYHGDKGKHSYFCESRTSSYGERYCQSIAGSDLDSRISDLALKALEPASLELSLEVAENLERKREELDALWRKRLERSGYEAERAARQYSQVEPENRLVARQLERDWEEKLKQKRALEEEYERLLKEQPRVLSQEEREAIQELATDIPALWNASRTTSQDRKEILRQVIDHVEVDVQGESERVRLRVHWAGAAETTHNAIRSVGRYEQLSYWLELKDRVTVLFSRTPDTVEIAARLNAEGWRPPKRKAPFDRQSVLQLLYRLGLRVRCLKPPCHEGLAQHEWTRQGLAEELGMPVVTLHAWIHRGWVKGRRAENGHWILHADPSDLERLRSYRKLPRGYPTLRQAIAAQEGANALRKEPGNDEKKAHGGVSRSSLRGQ